MKKTQRSFNSTARRKTPLKRSTKPIQRRVELQAGKGFMISVHPNDVMRTKTLAKRSLKAQGFDGWRAQERAAVKVRAERIFPAGTDPFFPMCEAPDCREEGEHCHHNFGRTDEPFSSWRHLCTWLCFDHHEQVTGRVGTGLNKALRMRLRVDCAVRVHAFFQPAVDGQLTMWSDQDWLNWLTMFIGNMKFYGNLPPEYKERR